MLLESLFSFDSNKKDIDGVRLRREIDGDVYEYEREREQGG